MSPLSMIWSQFTVDTPDWNFKWMYLIIPRDKEVLTHFIKTSYYMKCVITFWIFHDKIPVKENRRIIPDCFIPTSNISDKILSLHSYLNFPKNRKKNFFFSEKTPRNVTKLWIREKKIKKNSKYTPKNWTKLFLFKAKIYKLNNKRHFYVVFLF